MHDSSIENLANWILNAVKFGADYYPSGFFYGATTTHITFEGISFEDRLINDNGKIVCLGSKKLMQLVAITYAELCYHGLFDGYNFKFDIQDVYIRNNHLIIEPILYRYYDIKKSFGINVLYRNECETALAGIFYNYVYYPLMEKYHGDLDAMEQDYIVNKINEYNNGYGGIIKYIYHDISDEKISEVEKLLYEREIAITKQIEQGQTPDLTIKNDILNFDKKLGLLSINDNYHSDIIDSPLTDFVIARDATVLGNIGSDNSLAGRYGYSMTSDRTRRNYDTNFRYVISNYNGYETDYMNIRYDICNKSLKNSDRLLNYIPAAFSSATPIRPFIRNASFIIDNLPNKYDIKEIEFGEFFQMAPDLLTEDKLEYEFKRENLQILEDSFIYGWMFDFSTPKSTSVYLYNEKKYIRIPFDSLEYGKAILSNGKEYKNGDYVWIECSPVVWQKFDSGYYRNRISYEDILEPIPSLVTKKSIFCGVAYDTIRYKYFPFSHVYEYMYKYMEKTMFQNMSINDPKVIESARIKALKR